MAHAQALLATRPRCIKKHRPSRVIIRFGKPGRLCTLHQPGRVGSRAQPVAGAPTIRLAGAWAPAAQPAPTSRKVRRRRMMTRCRLWQSKDRLSTNALGASPSPPGTTAGRSPLRALCTCMWLSVHAQCFTFALCVHAAPCTLRTRPLHHAGVHRPSLVRSPTRMLSPTLVGTLTLGRLLG